MLLPGQEMTDLIILTTVLDKFGIDYEMDDDDDGDFICLKTDGDHTGPSYCYAEYRFKKDGSFHDWGVYD